MLKEVIPLNSKLDFKVTISNPKPIDRKPLSENIIIKFGHKENKWIGVAPFAAFKGKAYPLNLMEEVIEELSSKGITIFLFGGGHHEIEILKRIETRRYLGNRWTGIQFYKVLLQLKNNLQFPGVRHHCFAM